MKSILFALALVSLSTSSAFAISLQDALNQQTQIEIQPVTFQGLSIGAYGWAAGEPDAASVCQALGFVRLVRVTTEPCVNGEKLGAFRGKPGSALRFAKTDLECKEGGVRLRLASISCAK